MRSAVAAALLLLLAAASAQAQTAVRDRRRPQPAPAAPTPAPASSTPTVAGVSLAPSARPGGLAAGGLSSGGLRAIGDGGAVCRSSCARARYACEISDDTCGPQWASCLKSCSDGGGSFGAALLPR